MFEPAEIEGPGMIEQIWMNPTGNWRFAILRIYSMLFRKRCRITM
jgi:hypothetical protein